MTCIHTLPTRVARDRSPRAQKIIAWPIRSFPFGPSRRIVRSRALEGILRRRPGIRVSIGLICVIRVFALPDGEQALKRALSVDNAARSALVHRSGPEPYLALTSRTSIVVSRCVRGDLVNVGCRRGMSIRVGRTNVDIPSKGRVPKRLSADIWCKSRRVRFFGRDEQLLSRQLPDGERQVWFARHCAGKNLRSAFFGLERTILVATVVRRARLGRSSGLLLFQLFRATQRTPRFLVDIVVTTSHVEVLTPSTSFAWFGQGIRLEVEGYAFYLRSAGFRRSV
jgi:hypothetical protein